MKTLVDFTPQLAHYRLRVEKMLEKVLTSSSASDRLMQAMRYTMLQGGKRLRPILVYATGECFGAEQTALDYAAAAIECIHGFSLIHDDLPAMDNDDLRRGKPTCHIAFDEATAILAGDALQSLAFELMASIPHSLLSADIRIKLIEILACKSGVRGMAGGQMLDLLAEGKSITAIELENIHALKTGSLIQASVQLGAQIAAVKDADIIHALNIFSLALGLAFQLQDDLLDVIGQRDKVGKNTKKDLQHQKATYPTLLGIDTTQRRIDMLTTQAVTALQNIPQNTTALENIAQLLRSRDV